MAKPIPVRVLVTTGLELIGASLLTVAGLLAFGVAGALAVLGGFCLAASFSITRGRG